MRVIIETDNNEVIYLEEGIIESNVWYGSDGNEIDATYYNKIMYNSDGICALIEKFVDEFNEGR